MLRAVHEMVASDPDCGPFTTPAARWEAAISATLAWAQRAIGASQPGPAPVFAEAELRALDSRAQLSALSAPGAYLRAQLGELAAAQAAHLQLDHPPGADTRPPGLGALWLAAGLCVRHHPPLASALWRACEPPAATWELIVRHALAAPALASLAASRDPGAGHLADDLRAASPLTAICDRPWPGGDDLCVAWVRDRLLASADGRALIIRMWATPPALRATSIWSWRARLIERLRVGAEGARQLALDIYELTCLHHRDAAREAIEMASAALASGAERAPSVSATPVSGEQRVAAAQAAPASSPPASSEPGLDSALAVASWWAPLWHLRRAHPEAVATRAAIDIHTLLAALRLCAQARALTGASRGATR